MTIRFDEESHTYWNGDIRLPSVSEVLTGSGATTSLASIPKPLLEYAAARGTAVHLAIELLEEDDLDWDSVALDCIPFVEAYQLWKKEVGPEILQAEVIVHTKDYAGRFDQLLRTEEHGIVLNDLKTSSRLRSSHFLQIAAYANALDEVFVDKGSILHLMKDGTYEWVVFEVERPIDIWQDFLKAYLARETAMEHLNDWKKARRAEKKARGEKGVL